jgi:hypothetical protein
VQTYLFSGINSANTHVLNTGDFIRVSVTANTTRLCLVNEYPTGGTDADAGSFDGTSIRVNLGDISPGVTHTVTFDVMVD